MEQTMKSITEMTADEMKAARESGQRKYGTTMFLDRGPSHNVRTSDIEDYDPEALLKTIAKMKQQGWREVPNNRYIVAGLHPKSQQEPAA